VGRRENALAAVIHGTDAMIIFPLLMVSAGIVVALIFTLKPQEEVQRAATEKNRFASNVVET
jgi:hypothetical protein